MPVFLPSAAIVRTHNMSRIDEVLRRSGSVLVDPPAVDAVDPAAVAVSIERYAPEPALRTVEFPKSRTMASPEPPARKAEPLVTRRAERVSPSFSESLQGRLVTDGNTLPASIEQYRRVAA